MAETDMSALRQAWIWHQQGQDVALAWVIQVGALRPAPLARVWRLPPTGHLPARFRADVSKAK